MLTLPDVIVSIFVPFATLFTSPTWQKAQVLLVGAVLTPGQRTVAAALCAMGRSGHRDYTRYHEVLNRAVWSSREVARVLLVLLLQHLDGGDGPLIFGIDETLERRRGAKIRARAIYRDPVRSSRHQLVKASGLRWISLMWLGQVPWAGRHWALPVLTVLAPSTRYYQQQGRRHKKLTGWARQMVMQLRRWLPQRPLVLVGDVNLLLSSDCVPLSEKRICHPVLVGEVGDPARASALARSLALSFLVGGLSADAYFFAVFLAMAKFRAMARRESPCSRACCTASQRACWVSVGVRRNWWRTGFVFPPLPLAATSSSLTSSSSDDSDDSRAARRSR